MTPHPKTMSEASWGGLEYRRFLDCVHCGLCLSSCPTYVELGTEMDSPRGRIYLMKGLRDGDVQATPEVVRHIDLCLGCRACESACPSGVHYGELFESARAHLAGAAARPRRKDLWTRLVHAIFPYPERLRRLLAPVRLAQRFGLWPLLRRLLPPAALLPDLIPAAESLPEETPAQGAESGRVGLLLGCVNRVLFGGVNSAAARVLARNGYRVLVPSGQGCCGALHVHSGDRDTARELARATIDAFPRDVDAVIVTAAGCGAVMKEYAHLLHDDVTYGERAREFSAKVRDVSEFLAALPLVPPTSAIAARVTYHDACHLAHAQRICDQPRALLAAIPGIELVELEESDLCCGSAGSYNLTEPGMARRLVQRKIAKLRATGAAYVVAGNPGCALQIAAGLRKAGVKMQVVHPVELLDLAYGGAVAAALVPASTPAARDHEARGDS